MKPKKTNKVYGLYEDEGYHMHLLSVHRTFDGAKAAQSKHMATNTWSECSLIKPLTLED